MATKVNDLRNQAAFASAFPPALFEDDATGPVLDMIDGDDQAFLILQLSTLSPGWQVSVSVQESDQSAGGTWDTISSAGLNEVASAGVYTRNFARKKRYLRCLLERTGSPTLSVLIGQQKKLC